MWDDPRRTRSRRGPGHARAIRRALKNAHPARGLTANPKERIVVVASRSAASARAVNHRRARTPTTVYASPAGQPPRPQNAALRRAAAAASAAPRLPHLPLRFAPRRANARIRALAPLRPARPPAAPAIGVIPGGRPRAPALRARSARGLRPARCVIAPSGRTPRSGLRAPAQKHIAPRKKRRAPPLRGPKVKDQVKPGAAPAIAVRSADKPTRSLRAKFPANLMPALHAQRSHIPIRKKRRATCRGKFRAPAARVHQACPSCHLPPRATW